VRYYVGTTEITAAVVAGTYVTPILASGATLVITAKVKVLSSAKAGSSVTRQVAITSTADSGAIDVVSFTGGLR
jgi:hypothetical protein